MAVFDRLLISVFLVFTLLSAPAVATETVPGSEPEPGTELWDVTHNGYCRVQLNCGWGCKVYANGTIETCITEWGFFCFPSPLCQVNWSEARITCEIICGYFDR